MRHPNYDFSVFELWLILVWLISFLVLIIKTIVLRKQRLFINSLITNESPFVVLGIYHTYTIFIGLLSYSSPYTNDIRSILQYHFMALGPIQIRITRFKYSIVCTTGRTGIRTCTPKLGVYNYNVCGPIGPIGAEISYAPHWEYKSNHIKTKFPRRDPCPLCPAVD